MTVEAARTQFEPAPPRVSFPDLEQEILEFWREQRVFERSVEERPADRLFSFYEGPPTANGTPGVHHVLARVFKDLIPRYKTMRGYRAPRKGGWDTHGLPVELEAERELGLRNKREIEEYGVAAFNEQCRQSVFRYVADWERMTDRVGCWIDMNDAYVTYANEYIESCWWIFRRLWDRDLIFRDYRVTPHCPRCGTSLSSHEIALGYREDTPDPSVTVLFELKAGNAEGSPNAAADPALRLGDGVPSYVVAWTTTPWTLPGNTALAVSAEAEYALVEDGGRRLLLAGDRLRDTLPGDGDPVVLARVPGSALVGLEYAPLFESREWEGVETLAFEGGHTQLVEPSAAPARRVAAADFVATDDGTGVVHIAPAFGEEDYALGRAEGLTFLEPVGLDGAFIGGPWAGRFVKDADPAITADLDARGLLLASETIRHTYPFCWRCETPVLYYAKPSWYIRTTAVRDRLVANNQQIRWVPGHIRDGRFGEWLDGNVDWALSRERYWGTPLPFWGCEDCPRTDCIGSFEELAERGGLDGPPEDPHRPYIDEITLDCPDCGGEMRRTPEVADGWFDSGAMPYAQWHYPFENGEVFDARFPADFICEAVDQTRGWFYTLHALATLLHAIEEIPEGVAFRNVISVGLIEDAEGKKMAKSRGNAVDPWEVIDAHGADALRWYMYAAAPPGNSRRFSSELVGEASRRVLSTLWNTYSFFVTYANIAGFDPAAVSPEGARNELDRWVRSELHVTVRKVTDALDAYEPLDGARPIAELIDQLSNWYVRRSRRRFWKSDDSADTQAALHTLYECLTTIARLLAPFTPFLAEALHRNLEAGRKPGAADSVHLEPWPEADADAIDEQLGRDIAVVQRMVSLARAARSKAGIKVRQPLASAVLTPRTAGERESLARHTEQIAEELNVKAVAVEETPGDRVSYAITLNLPVLGPIHGRELPAVRAAIADLDPAATAATMRAGQPVEAGGYTIEPGGLRVAVEAAEGWSAAEDGGHLALVATELTPELAAEGLARDLVRRLQELRREAGLDVSDRIHVRYDGDDAIAAVAAAHGDYIAGETLALSLERAPDDAPEGAASSAADIEGHPVTLVLWKAGGSLMPDPADGRTLIWCTGISGSQRTDYITEAAEAIRAEGRSCLVIDIGELLEQLPDHLKVGASRTELLDGNEDVLRLHRSYALQNMLRMIEETTAEVVLVSTHACFLRNGRLMPGLDMHFIKEHFAGRISAFVTVVLDTPDVWRALARRPEWAGRLRLAEVALWRDFEVALTRMLAEYEGAPFYLLARRDPAEGLARLTRRPPAPSAYLSYPITAILQSGDSTLIDGARNLAERLRSEAGLVVFDPLAIEDLPDTKAGAPPDETRADGEDQPAISAEMEHEAEPYLVSHTVATDLQLIDQAEMVIVYYPTDKVSPGVFTEMSHARDRRKPLYLCEFPGAPERVSPFLGLFHTASFETVDGLIEHLRSEQQAD